MANGGVSGVRLLPLPFAIFLLPFAILPCGCRRESASQHTVVLYTSVDQPYAAPIAREFEQRTGIKVTLVTDAEATKSVGLAERVRAEKANPQCDVFWSNEPFHTINLAAEGLLQPFEAPAARDVPGQFKDPQHRWAGNALRARVIARSPDAPGPRVTALTDLTDPAFKGRVAIAMPTAGTTSGHVAALYVLRGEAETDRYLRGLRDNGVKLLGGNAKVAEAVGQGGVLVGLTDNDDVAAVRREGGKIEMILPDAEGDGTLAVPTTVGVVAGARNADAAKRLADYLLSPEVEKKLLDAQFAGWSVRDTSHAGVRWTKVDYAEVARAMPTATRRAREILEGRQ